jgi:hypothetical protein
MDAPCSGWVPNHSLCGSWAALSAAQQAYADRVAIRVIWAATGRQFGLCPVTVRPCWVPQEPLYQAFPVGYYGEGYWSLQGVSGGGVVVLANGSCACSSGCACSPPQVALPGPVDSIMSVIIDGVPLGPAAYRLDLGTYLVRTDGGSWPAPQNLAANAGATSTWTVSYLQGVAVPADLQDAAGLYACQIGKAIQGGNCQLPNRVRSVTRQGVSIDFIQEDDFLEKGRTGYDLVDSILATYNPHGLTQRPRFLSPDLPRFR